MRKNIIMTIACVVLMGGMSFALSNLVKKQSNNPFGMTTGFSYGGNTNIYPNSQAKPYKQSSSSYKSQASLFDSQPQFESTSSLFGTNRSAGQQVSVQSNEPVIAYSVYSNSTARSQSGYSNGSTGRAYNVLPIYSGSNNQQSVSNGNYGVVALATVSNNKSVSGGGVPGLKVWGDEDDDDLFNEGGSGVIDNDDFTNAAPVSGNVLILLLFAVGYVLIRYSPSLTSPKGRS